MNPQCELILSPTKLDMCYIQKWLEEELLNYKNGFYNNWNVIKKGFQNKQVFVYALEQRAIGFVLWRESTGFVSIDILTIMPAMRHQGIGSLFVDMLCNYFKSKNVFALKLQCTPIESISFWKGKKEFIRFPNMTGSESDQFYKPLVSTTHSTDTPNPNNKFELWNNCVKYDQPTWAWDMDGDLLNNPIIQPCHHDWWARWTKGEGEPQESAVKNFMKPQRDPFLYIDRDLVEVL